MRKKSYRKSFTWFNTWKFLHVSLFNPPVSFKIIFLLAFCVNILIELKSILKTSFFLLFVYTEIEEKHRFQNNITSTLDMLYKMYKRTYFLSLVFNHLILKTISSSVWAYFEFFLSTFIDWIFKHIYRDKWTHLTSSTAANILFTNNFFIYINLVLRKVYFQPQ